MNAGPLLKRIAAALHKCKLEAILIGNAAAALQGAPVTTMDFDFMFRETPQNLDKLKSFARLMGLPLSQPAAPMSNFFRLVDAEAGLQIDFLSVVSGVKSFASLRSRASPIRYGRAELLVAGLHDIIKSKRRANRSRDRAVMNELLDTLHEKERLKKRNHKAD